MHSAQIGASGPAQYIAFPYPRSSSTVPRSLLAAADVAQLVQEVATQYSSHTGMMPICLISAMAACADGTPYRVGLPRRPRAPPPAGQGSPPDRPGPAARRGTVRAARRIKPLIDLRATSLLPAIAGRQVTLAPARLGVRSPACNQRASALGTVAVPHARTRDHEEVAMSDSYRLGWPPGHGPGAGGPEAAPCARCGHRADSHLHPGSCSVRGRWWRRCRCSGYTRSDSMTTTA